MSCWRCKVSLTDREEFKQRMRNLDAEEKNIVVRVISNDVLVEELARRLTSTTNTLNQIREILNIQETY